MDGPDISGTELINGVMTYRLRPPQTNGAGSNIPLLVMMHGRGANEGDVYELVPYVNREFLIVAPRGVEVHEETERGAYRWFNWSGEESNTEMFEPAIQKLSALVEELAQQFPLNRSRIYFGGFSQGASMACLMSLVRPELVAGVIAHSGFLPPSPGLKTITGNASGKPFFFAHGTGDELISLEQAHTTADLLKEAGAQVEFREYPLGHETSPESRRDLADWLHRQAGITL
jgi:phospholipase/carboxylesterase